MREEFDVLGVFVPALLVWGVAALLVTSLLRRGLAAAGVYRFVWHRPLFDLAVFIIVLGGIVAAVSRLSP